MGTCLDLAVLQGGLGSTAGGVDGRVEGVSLGVLGDRARVGDDLQVGGGDGGQVGLINLFNIVSLERSAGFLSMDGQMSSPGTWPEPRLRHFQPYRPRPGTGRTTASAERACG